MNNRPAVIYDKNKPRKKHSSETIPLELMSLIEAARVYGKKTHSLGALKTISALKDFNSTLKKVNESLNNVELNNLISKTETEIVKIQRTFSVSYEE